MNTEMTNAVKAANDKAQYDERAKRLLSQKHILAHILVKTVDEFIGMDPRDVIPYIEGEPKVGVVPLEPGLTNKDMPSINGERIIGLNTENSEANEGLVRFDIIFYVRMKDGLSQMIVNVEAQKDEPMDYDIVNRSIFYVGRILASQKGRDFTNMRYNDIKRVFSISICMNMDEDCMNYIQLINKPAIGNHMWKGNLELGNIVLIGLSKELPEHDEPYELHRLLSVLFSSNLSEDEKLDIMETEYNIPLEDNIRREVSAMCNLSQRVWEDGKAEGEARGSAMGEAKIIINMDRKGFTLEQIADATNKDVEEIKAIIKHGQTVPV